MKSVAGLPVGSLSAIQSVFDLKLIRVDHFSEQDRQCSHNITLRHVRVTIVAVGKK